MLASYHAKSTNVLQCMKAKNDNKINCFIKCKQKRKHIDMYVQNNTVKFY